MTLNIDQCVSFGIIRYLIVSVLRESWRYIVLIIGLKKE